MGPLAVHFISQYKNAGAVCISIGILEYRNKSTRVSCTCYLLIITVGIHKPCNTHKSRITNGKTIRTIRKITMEKLFDCFIYKIITKVNIQIKTIRLLYL